jgi:hypothetical protein
MESGGKSLKMVQKVQSLRCSMLFKVQNGSIAALFNVQMIQNNKYYDFNSFIQRTPLALNGEAIEPQRIEP